VNLAALGEKNAIDRTQTERIGDKRVERIARDGDDPAASHSGGGAFDSFGFWLVLIDFDQIGGHVSVSVS
jgi:hypothetical protein